MSKIIGDEKRSPRACLGTSWAYLGAWEEPRRSQEVAGGFKEEEPRASHGEARQRQEGAMREPGDSQQDNSKDENQFEHILGLPWAILGFFWYRLLQSWGHIVAILETCCCHFGGFRALPGRLGWLSACLGPFLRRLWLVLGGSGPV